jgi:hypothetical protein
MSPLPRLIRHRDAPAYLGMDRNRFNREVRPHLMEIPIGNQGIAFDRLDLDAWVDQYKARNGRPGDGGKPWPENAHPDLLKGTGYGTSTKSSAASDFAKAAARATSKKRTVT